mmetsp:Transcript_26409/g.39036  ORF Transcript_26409/g.39036 Transcript_26409/m.39036 type:complete len:567 (-) Transcript_26409:35-1735(-)
MDEESTQTSAIPAELADHSDTALLPDSLEHFLSLVGIVNNSPSFNLDGSLRTFSPLDPSEEDEDIFESGFDLSRTRLRFVFDMFDEDTAGRISYDCVQRGMEVQLGDFSEVDQESFRTLIKHLDLDGSGDVSFEEFCEGIQLLMLRAFLHPSLDLPELPILQIFDYDNNRLKQRVVASSTTNGIVFSSHIQCIPRNEFYFRDKPVWAKNRWINILSSESLPIEALTLTLRRLAVKYSLHPLALEDALQEHRPKVEVYDNHYHIMVPYLSIVQPETKKVHAKHRKGSFTASVSSGVKRYFNKALFCRQKKSNGISRKIYDGVPILDYQISSIFVDLSQNGTIITFCKGNTETAENINKLKDSQWRRVQMELNKRYSKLRQYDVQYLTYALLDQAVDNLNPVRKAFQHELNIEIEYQKEHNYGQSLQKVHTIRKSLERISQICKPFIRLVTHVIEDPAVSPGATVYLKDVLDNLEYQDEEIKQLIIDCHNADAEADKCQLNKRDSTLYTLTVITAFFLPAQFFTGVWGMNFVSMPELDDTWLYPSFFWCVIGALFVIMMAFLHFRRVH